MEQVCRLAATLEDYPYVRLKRFKINVAVTPSLRIEFENERWAAKPAICCASLIRRGVCFDRYEIQVKPSLSDQTPIGAALD